MNISAWLKEQRIAAEAYDAGKLLNDFLHEMERGLNGEPSSLAMIPAYVNSRGTVPHNKLTAVIDAGGTNLRICLAQFDEAGKIELSHFCKQPMPGREREATASEFFAVLTDALEPLKDKFEQIGFCFSYPAEITPNLDGRLIHWTKEIKIPQLVGQCVGAGLIQALEARGIHDKKVVVLNDTVAALLAGMAQGQTFSASSYIGFILGTGTNTAYEEENQNIGKLNGYLGRSAQVINVESGGFSAFERGSIDRQLDEQSENPGGHLFEKTISGVYMGDLALALLKALVAEGCFSTSGGAGIRALPKLSTIHIDNLTANNGRDIGPLANECFTQDDYEVIRTVFRAVVDRAALLTAVNILAAIVKSGVGRDPAHPVCINIDGSTYYKTSGLADRVQRYLSEMLRQRNLHIRCIQVEDAPIVGAAIAGLTAFN